MEKLLIEVFDGENRCSGLCVCMRTTMEPVINQMKIVEKEIENEYGEDTVVFKAYNLRRLDTRLEDFPVVNELVNKDYALPILLINGKPAMAGGITAERVLEIIREVLQKL